MIIGILPYVKITNLIRDANSAKSMYSGTLRLTVSRAREKWWKRICCLLDEFQAIGLRIPGCGAAKNQVDFTEEHKIFGTEAQRAFLKGTLRHVKISDRQESIARSYSEVGTSRAQSATFFSPSEVWSVPAPSSKRLEER